ncbi:2-phospho-L-lactate guanylyltransferase [Steroidobacter flavus]|uniref:3-phospho-D-glycerate guanylyltransferase n=1 Tax=Steroidobacter flavus TaxID=1842136 RepID=A0ABV8T4J6_9GAMM
MSASTWALVPLKSSERAKSRLAGALDAEQRRRLFFSLAERVISALTASKSVDAVAVVTSSHKVAAFARSIGAVPIMQEADVGMSPALDLALQILQTMQPQRVLMVPGDLPLITARAVDAIFEAQLSSEHVVLAPDRRREGTNALLCSPPKVLAPRFGADSFARHLSAARSAGIATSVIESEELALDLDCVDDLDYLRSQGSDRSKNLLVPVHAPLHAALVG